MTIVVIFCKVINFIHQAKPHHTINIVFQTLNNALLEDKDHYTFFFLPLSASGENDGIVLSANFDVAIGLSKPIQIYITYN